MSHILNNLKLHVNLASVSAVDPSWTKTRFIHPHHRIYYITEGEAEIVLTEQTVQLKAGNMYLLPAYRLVKAVYRQFMTHYYVHFQAVSSFNSDLFELFRPRISVAARDAVVRPLFELILEHWQGSCMDSNLNCIGALQLLLAPFFERVETDNRNRERFYPVLEYVERHLEKKLTLRELANISGLNPVYFSNQFSDVFGLPPSQYVIRKRLERAQELLTRFDLPMKEIAQACGIENQMYFSRIFRQKTGMTPSEFQSLLSRSP